MKRLLILSCLLLAACDLETEDRRPQAGRLVLMALNAEFLWDGVAPEDQPARTAGSRSKRLPPDFRVRARWTRFSVR